METLQGLDAAEIAKTPFGRGEQANVEALAAWIAGRVRGHAHQPAATTPRSAHVRARQARLLLPRRADGFLLRLCHGEDGKRIRLQDLPNLTKNPATASASGLAGLPVSNGEMWSMQLRLNDCYRQQRFPVTRLRVGRDDRAGRVHGRQRQGGVEAIASAIKR